LPEPLEASRAVFDRTVARAWRLRKRGAHLPAAVWAQIAAHFATYRHNGLYTSGELESLLLDIAKVLPSPPGSPPEFEAPEKRPPRRRILHVLTRALPIGGHTRVVERWARNDPASTHSLVATAQTDPLPSWLEEAIAESGGFFETLAGSSRDLLSRALRLRAIAGAWADVVVLHVHPYDVVPPIAFGVDGGPPVILFNHSDATFWLGSRTADVVADIRESGRRHSLQRRGVRSSVPLPVPLVLPPGGVSREAAKRQLGIAATATVLFTAGEDFKFVPRGEHDFFRTAGRILSRRGDAILVAAGSSDPRRWRSYADRLAPGRFLFHGPEEKIGLLQAAADIYLDPFPAASLTVALETAARGVPLVGLRQPTNPLFSSSDDPAFEAGPGHVGSLEDYERRADALIGNPRMRAREGLDAARAVAAFHMPPGWNAALERLLAALPPGHVVSPETPAPDAPGEADLFLAEFEASGAPDFDLRSCIAPASRYLNNRDRAGLLLEALRGGEHAPLLPFKSYLPEACLVLGKRVLRGVSALRGRRSL
jgi:hypothetical protein